MNETLKGVAHIGAELAAAKADLQREMERHRKTWRQLEQVTGLLGELREITSEYAWDVDLEARVDAALSQQAEPAPINQCDGCQAGIPADEKGYHRMGKPGGYADLMYCERKRYVAEPAPAQDDIAAFVAAYSRAFGGPPQIEGEDVNRHAQTAQQPEQSELVTLPRELVLRAVAEPTKNSVRENHKIIIDRGRAQAEIRAAMAAKEA